MTRVITYGTYDLLHEGHINLLKRAKNLGDYLIVGVTADDFDKNRGKINVQQSLMERVEAIKSTGLADEIIIEEYEGQKIDDIHRYEVDIFTVGSDWRGTFDYLDKYCQVIYLPRTEGVSSTEIRSDIRSIRIGLVGEVKHLRKFIKECSFVNGTQITGICTLDEKQSMEEFADIQSFGNDYDSLLDNVDALYIVSHPQNHYVQVKKALERKKHVLCESPIVLKASECMELHALSREMGCVLMDGIKTAYSTAFSRLILIIESGVIGKIISVDATCTSLNDVLEIEEGKTDGMWNSICTWGPIGLLPVFKILGVDYVKKIMVSNYAQGDDKFDNFTKIDFIYKNAVANILVGKAVKSEGDLIISGTKGYIYVPSPWWKTDYFELRFENPQDNKRYFYQLDGEGIRYEIVDFLRAITTQKTSRYIDEQISVAICSVMEDFYNKKDSFEIS